MSIFTSLRSNSTSREQTKQSLNFLAFDLGSLSNTQISIWLEALPVTTSYEEFTLRVTVKNEGNRIASELTLSIKTSGNLNITNRAEVFGSVKNKLVIQKLSPNKSITYLAKLKIDKDCISNQITAVVSTKNLSGQTQNLESTLDFFRQISRLGA
jgi:hypothetical protein